MTFLAPQIDHVVVNVATQLDEAAAQYRRLGFQLTERGHHTLGTSNNLAVFGPDYLELVGFERGNEGRRVEVAGYPTGLSGLVFRPPPCPGLAETLNAMGVPAEPAKAFSRPVTLPGGPRDARFSTVHLRDALESGRVYFCHHHTPELVWRDEWRQHPNGAAAIAEFVIAAADPAASAAPFGRMFGPDALSPVEGGLALTAADARIVLLSREAVAARYGALGAAPLQGRDRMVALGLRTTSLAATRAALAAGTIEGVVEAEGRLTVPAAAACGVVLSFQI